METTRTVITEEVSSLIAESLGIPRESVTPGSKIVDLSEDSIRLFELLLTFERKYRINTTYEDVVRLETVGDIIDYIESKVPRHV